MFSGIIELPIAPTTTRATLRLDTGTRELAVGHLDPVDTLSGVRARLANLGYDTGDDDEFAEEALAWAIEEFLCDQGMAPASTMTDAFRAALQRVHGS